MALLICAELGVMTNLWVVVAASVVNGIGAGRFFPANSAAVVKTVSGDQFGVASGLPRTFANVGTVFSFAVAILVPARHIPCGLAVAIFAGTTHLPRHLAGAFNTGLQVAYLSSIGFMVPATILSATRVGQFHQSIHGPGPSWLWSGPGPGPGLGPG